MRAWLLAAVVLAGAALGLGAKAPGKPTLRQMLAAPGEDVALVPGTSDYAPGSIRFSFLVLTHQAQVVLQPKADVWIAHGLDKVPFEHVTATLQSVGVPGVSTLAPSVPPQTYVVTVYVKKPGLLWALAQPIGGKPIQGVANIQVKRRTFTPPVGGKAPVSDTPTIASTHGNFQLLTTVHPPDRVLLQYSIAGSLKAHKPFVVVFATPAFCTSRLCGPEVDVVERVREQLHDPGVRYIHVEIYKNNDPKQGFNQFVKEWNLPTEPWVFLVGRDGLVRAKFEGAVSVEELSAAVKRVLR